MRLDGQQLRRLGFMFLEYSQGLLSKKPESGKLGGRDSQ
jgi:hypothetical protein